MYRLVLQSLLLVFLLVSCQKRGYDHAASSSSATSAAEKVPLSEIEIAEEKIKVAPNYENYTQLGLAYASEGRTQDALSAFQKSAKLNPQSDIAENNICSQWIVLGEYQKAKIACNKALKLNPKLAIAANNLKLIAEKIASLKTEISKIQASLSTLSGPALTDALIDLGYKHFQVQDFETSIRVWSKVKKGDPKYSVVLNNLASANILLKRFPLAEKLLEEAGALDPSNTLIQNNKKWLKEERDSKGAAE